MSIKLSDAQLVMLSAASQRDDRCVTPPSSMRGIQLVKTGEKLIAAGLAREVKAKPSSPVWRRDSESGIGYALKLTVAGAKAIAVDDAPASDGGRDGAMEHSIEAAVRTDASATKIIEKQASRVVAPERVCGEPRPTSKIAAVIEMLSRSGGASLADLIATTGWLPHTTRAALTGLRKRGFEISLDRSDR